MSTILRALRRLEQEKSARSDRSLGEAVANTAPPPPKRGVARWVVVSGSVAGALAIAAIVFWVVRPGDPVEPVDRVEIAQAPPATAHAEPREAAPARRNAERADAASETNLSRALAARNARAENRRTRRPEAGAPPSLPPAALTSDVAVVKRPPVVSRLDDADAEVPPPAMPLPEEIRAALEAAGAASQLVPAGARPTAGPGARSASQLTAEIRAALEAASAASQLPSAAEPPTAVPSAPPAETPASPESPKLKLPVGEVPRRVNPPRPALGKTGSAEAAPTRAERSEPPRPATQPKPPATPELKPPVEIAAVAPPPAPREEPVPARTAPPAARPKAAPKSLSKSTAIAQSPVSRVYVERTIWHPYAERRIAIVAIEGREEALELHEGDAVGSLVVGKIEPSGVVFNHDGVELRRRVGAR